MRCGLAVAVTLATVLLSGPSAADEVLVRAVAEGNTAAIEQAIARGADPNIKMPGGVPVFTYAVVARKWVSAEALLRAGADIDARDQRGATALHWAALFGRRGMVNLLLQAGADVNVGDNEGSTPLTVAQTYGYRLVAEDLQKSGGRAPTVARTPPLDISLPLDRPECAFNSPTYDRDRAIAACGAIISDPASTAESRAAAHLHRAQAHGQRTDDPSALKLAIADYEAAIALSGNHAAPFRARCELFMNVEAFEAALIDCSRAIGVEPNDAITYFMRGRIHSQFGEFGQAAEDYGEAVRLNPQVAIFRQWRCQALALEGFDLHQALYECGRALWLEPRSTDALEGRALAYYKLSMFEFAIADYDASIKSYQRNATAWYGRGLAKLKKGDATGHDDIANARSLQADISERLVLEGVP